MSETVERAWHGAMPERLWRKHKRMFELEAFLPFLVIGIALLGEIVLSALWQPVYFNHGISIYSHTWQFQQVEQFTSNVPALNKIARHFNKYPFVEFHILDQYGVAFAESQDALMLHGIIRVDPMLSQIKIVGYLNWVWPFAFLYFVLLQDGIGLLILCVVLVIVTMMHRKDCKRISQLVYLSVNDPPQFTMLLEKGTGTPSPAVQKWRKIIVIGIGIIVIWSLVSWLITAW